MVIFDHFKMILYHMTMLDVSFVFQTAVVVVPIQQVCAVLSFVFLN